MNMTSSSLVPDDAKETANHEKSAGRMDCVQSNEIITIGVGQSGVHMLNAFMSTIMEEHKIDHDGRFAGNWNEVKDKLLIFKHNTYFTEAQSKENFIPRCIFMDSDRTSVDAIYESYLGRLVPEAHFLGKGGAVDPMLNWAKGHYTDGAEIMDEYLHVCHRLTERCDHPQGFQVFHSIAGGFGGGFGTHLVLKLRDDYPDRAIMSVSDWPCLNKPYGDFGVHHSTCCVYNSILSLHQLLENTDLCLQFDNGVMSRMAMQLCGVRRPTYADLNFLIAQVLSGVTSTFRFHCEPNMNATMTGFGVCMIPFPRLHFFATTHAPFLRMNATSSADDDDDAYHKNTKNVNAIIKGVMWSNEVSGVKCFDDGFGKIMNAAIAYRGSDADAIHEMDTHLCQAQTKFQKHFLQWIPGINVHSAYVSDADNHQYKAEAPVIATAVVATTAIRSKFQTLSQEFAKAYRRKAFLHWYKNEGMDEMEFQEADKNVRDLVTEYRDKEDAVVDVDSGDDDSEEDEGSDYERPCPHCHARAYQSCRHRMAPDDDDDGNETCSEEDEPDEDSED